jgi:DNA polymerase-3 subunit delta
MLERVNAWKSEFEKKYGNGSCVQIDGSNIEEGNMIAALRSAIAPSLFFSKKLLLCRNCLPTKASQDDLAEVVLQIIQSQNPDMNSVFYNTKKLDKRLSAVKTILNSGAEIVEFEVPSGYQFGAWIKRRAATMEALVDEQAVSKLVEFMGGVEAAGQTRYGQNEPAYNLWQADNELKKLAGYSKNITSKNVELLVEPQVPANIFTIADGMASGKVNQSLKAAEDLFESESVDDKGIAIKIVGMLAQQFKGILFVRLLSKKKLDNAAIARALDWTPQRTAAVSRSAANFSEDRCRRILSELSRIDLQLKSTDHSPRLLILNLINKNK